MEKRANDKLNNVDQWMRSNNLTLHSRKNLALNISSYRCNPSLNLTLTFHANLISTFNSAKYLGLLVDDHLSFKNHITFLENKILRSVGIMRELRYHLPSNALLVLYYSLIHTQSVYVLSAWASAFPTYSTKITLKKLHN